MSLFSSSVDYPVYLIESALPGAGATAVMLSSPAVAFGDSVPGGTPGPSLTGTSDDNGLLGAIQSYLEANGAENVTVTLYNESSSTVSL